MDGNKRLGVAAGRWPCAAAAAIGWAVAEIEEVDGGGALVRPPEERYGRISLAPTVPSRQQ